MPRFYFLKMYISILLIKQIKKIAQKKIISPFFAKLHYAIKKFEHSLCAEYKHKICKFQISCSYYGILTLEICIIQQILRFCKLHCADLMR